MLEHSASSQYQAQLLRSHSKPAVDKSFYLSNQLASPSNVIDSVASTGVNSSAPAQGVVSQSIMKEMNKIYGGSALKNHRNKAATPLLNH